MSSEWTGRLTSCLQEIVDYERGLEDKMSSVRWRMERQLGIPSAVSQENGDNVRRRASMYPLLPPSDPSHPSEYGDYVSRMLHALLEILLDDPVIAGASNFSDGQWVIGLELFPRPANSHQMLFMSMGLVDYALEHSPEAAANALADVIQRGEERELTSHSIVLFRGLHVESRYDFPDGLSIVSFEEARQYVSEQLVPSMLRGNGVTDDGPIGAVVSEVKWGPAFVPVRSGEEDEEDDGLDWTEDFRDDALLLVDLLAVTHEVQVVSAGWRTRGVERQIERLLGRTPTLFLGHSESGRHEVASKPPTNPAASAGALADCADLYSRMPRDDVRLRLALSRLASSLARTGPHSAQDKIIDVAIALEVMYELDARDRGAQLSRRARNYLGQDRQDNKWIDATARHTYKLRNAIAHGTLPEYTEQAYLDGLRLGRRTLAHVIHSGRPLDWDRR